MDHPEKLKVGQPAAEAGNASVTGSEAQNENLDFRVASGVREVMSNVPAEQAKGTSGGARQPVVTKTPQERKAELLARLPKDQDRAERYMRRQVTVTLEKQLHELEGQLHHASNYHDMNAIMAKIRHFRDLLADLAHLAFEQLKSLWLQFVHNLSI